MPFDPNTMTPVEQKNGAKTRVLVEHGPPKAGEVVLVTPERG